MLTIAGCAPSSSLEDGGDTGDENVFRVGILAPMTGFVAAIGTDLEQGWNLFWDENGTEVGNFTVETILEDDASSAETALTKATRLVQEENVDVVVGPVLANQALAVGDHLTQEGVANLAQSSADDITQREASPLVLRAGALAGSQTTFRAASGPTTKATAPRPPSASTTPSGGVVRRSSSARVHRGGRHRDQAALVPR